MDTRTEILPHAHTPRFTWLSSLYRKVVKAVERSRQRRQLAQLTAEQLADFGATQADRLQELEKGFWRD
jgi:uncharacterized protein YjiS (DUF1127 family)